MLRRFARDTAAQAERSHASTDKADPAASSRHALTSPTGRVYETQVTNSYAAPVVTAAVHELLRKSPPLSLTVAEVYEKLAGRQVDISRSRPDFITEAIVYHPSAAPVCQEDLFFTVRAVAHTAAQWRQALREHPGIPTVLLPSATGEGMDAVLDWLYEKQCPGLLCAGPFPAKSGLPPVLLWEEGCCKSFPEYQFPADCASIAITPASQTALHLAKTLQRKFQADGYGCTVVSDLPAGILAVLLALLVLPVGVRVCYDVSGLRICLLAGPIRWQLLPAKSKWWSTKMGTRGITWTPGRPCWTRM